MVGLELVQHVLDGQAGTGSVIPQPLGLSQLVAGRLGIGAGGTQKSNEGNRQGLGDVISLG